MPSASALGGQSAATPPAAALAATAPIVVLCSRGFSFELRLDQIRQQARRKGIGEVVLLHSPETRYSEAMVREVRERAERAFRLLNELERKNGETETHFRLVLVKGKLYDNLRTLLSEHRVDTVFVGMTMFDERINSLKNAGTDFHFLGESPPSPHVWEA